MKIKSLNVTGFRGFNDTRHLEFSPTVTLIAAQNSYGKTSISEAFEWLLYGRTSKVENADSKDEYKGSYRNVHLAPNQAPSVMLVVDHDGREMKLHAKLPGGQIERLVNGNKVEAWPFEAELNVSARPFILQHALKDLLLATPAERFANFAKLLGFEELGQLQKEIVALCTRPSLPREILLVKNRVAALEDRVVKSDLKDLSKAFKMAKSAAGLFAAVRTEARKHVPSGTEDISLLPRLRAIRDEAVAKIFKGSVAIALESTVDSTEFIAETGTLVGLISPELIKKYTALSSSEAQQRLAALASFYDLGVSLLTAEPDKCPLCSQPVDDELRLHIEAKHRDLLAQRSGAGALTKERESVIGTLADLKQRLTTLSRAQNDRVVAILSVEPHLEQVGKLLVGNEKQLLLIRQALVTLKDRRASMEDALARFAGSCESVTKSIECGKEDLELIEELAKSVVNVVAAIKGLHDVSNEFAPGLQEADSAIRLVLDSLAGTQIVSLLVDLLQAESAFDQTYKINTIIDSLKVIRAVAEEYVGSKMASAISGDFGKEVMQWYDKIRTLGDPKVHFSGFDLRRTPQGNRVQIKAESYGKELVSAVSSLSESKLNALGLCMSIAINITTGGMFEFLIIDDPIQSWDADHEEQFITVVRDLAKRGKQIIILSHNREWVDRVRQRCEEFDGSYYQITMYDVHGPNIEEKEWATVKQRLATIEGIAGNPAADDVTLQQAEEEFRHVVNQLAAGLKYKVFGVKVSTANMNSAETKKCLLECGVDLEFANKIVAAFDTIDDSHHTPTSYAPNRERIRQYLQWANVLVDRERKAVPVTKVDTAMTAMS